MLNACAHKPVTSGKSQTEVFQNEFQKICLSASGKGRIELLTTKHIFSYESQLDRVKNTFNLAFDFPVVGEKLLSLSLNPQIVNRDIKNSEISELLKDQIGEREDRARIAKSVEEFFVFSSEFLRYRANNKLPLHYATKLSDGHFIMERATPSYLFLVDNFAANDHFYERTVFKIFLKEHSTNPIVTLFLVPQTCE